MEFLQSTYEAAADMGKWDRNALECALGEKGKVRATEEFWICHRARVKPACSKHRGAQRELRFANTL